MCLYIQNKDFELYTQQLLFALTNGSEAAEQQLQNVNLKLADQMNQVHTSKLGAWDPKFTIFGRKSS